MLPHVVGDTYVYVCVSNPVVGACYCFSYLMFNFPKALYASRRHGAADDDADDDDLVLKERKLISKGRTELFFLMHTVEYKQND